MKTIRLFSRLIIGLVFMFSGFVKAVDPLGSAYKFHDYFQAFNMSFLFWLSLPLAIILCAVEFTAGFSILTGIRYKTGLWVIGGLMLVFTPLTLILALTNPVSDCGCFGDAIHLTNWQTFEKNIILVLLTLPLFIERKKPFLRLTKRTEWGVIVSAIILFTLFCGYNLRYLPVIDFLPYKTGIDINENMKIPEGVETDQYETTFIYKKDNQLKEFTLSNYPADDTTWQFVDQKSVLVKQGYVPPIHDFYITSFEGYDITNEILSDQGYSLLMVSKKFSEASRKKLNDGFELGKKCMDNNINFYILTATERNDFANYEFGLPYCSVDETTLKTMVRSNPGFILLKDGIIIGKWSWANIPDIEWLANQILSE